MMQAGRAIAFGIEHVSNLGIDELSRIQFTNALLQPSRLGRRFVAAHTPFVPEFLMSPVCQLI
jgi:hypothetical protein